MTGVQTCALPISPRSVPDDQPVTVAGVTFSPGQLTANEGALMQSILDLEAVVRLQQAQLDKLLGRPSRPGATVSEIVREFLSADRVAAF